MEVDLTDDDIIVTMPRNPNQSQTDDPSLLETVEISDDDDIIFVEDSDAPKTSEIAPLKSCTIESRSSANRESSHSNKVVEVDEVVRAVASICPPQQESSLSSMTSRHASRHAAGNPDKARESTSHDRMNPSYIEDSNIIDITDEDDPKRVKRKPDNTCLNVACKSGEDLAPAAMFVVSYYGFKQKKGKYDVCAECFNMAVDHQKELARRITLHQPLLSYENFPLNDIPVVDLESDEETSETEDPLPMSLLHDVEKDLEKVMEESLAKYDLDYQIKEATGILSEKMTSLELEAKEIGVVLSQFQKDIDAMRSQVYKNYDPIIRELPPLELTAYTPAIPCPVYHPPTAAKTFLAQESASKPFTQEQSNIVSPRSVTSLLKSPQQRPDASNPEIVAVASVTVPHKPLPPIGSLDRPKPRAGDIVYVMKMSFFGVWLRGRVMEVQKEPHMVNAVYKVRIEIQGNRKQVSTITKTVPGRHMAYPNPSAVRLQVGTRVIAVFQDDESHNQNKGGSYYSGLIAEPPKSNNRFRYLVFFDDGYAQYVPHDKILVVCESSRNVWDDIHPDSREFIRKYIEQYPERPMVKLAPNQVVKTEWNGKWWIARVVEVDGSLVKMSFDADKRTEWIYRGSTRLAPLYTELAQAQRRLESANGVIIRRMRGMGVQRVNQPYVEYTQNTGAEDDLSAPAVAAPPPTVRAVAKKSTNKKNESHVPVSFVPRPENIGVVKEMQLPKDAPMPKRYQTHTCGPHCIEWIKYNSSKMRGYNPLSIPLYCGWQRELPRYKKKSAIMYTAPCGRRLRSMEDLHRYLRICKSEMSVDLFDFDYWVNALSAFTLCERVKKYIVQEDISHGKENVKIPLINYVDHSLPNNLIYATQREPYGDVPLNTDPQFLCGCDCTDDCLNKEKCACWQLTIQGSALYPGGVVDPNVGYYYKRLQERVITGIYECNSQCKCSRKTCLNRVVQHPLQLQLQLFKTPNKGWGLRCVNDIPKGTFICIYAGYLYTEQTANKVGAQEGDDYLAELDYIEVVERMKEDYESDVEDDLLEDEENTKKPERDYGSEDKRSRNRSKEETDVDFKIGHRSSSGQNSDASIRSRLRKRTSAELDSSDDGKNEKASKRRESSQKSDFDADDDGSDEDKLERQPSSFTPKPLKKLGNVEEPTYRFQSVRKFYGPNERVYIMDANKVGNIGRYLNHSCSPNVFVQNVFVDSHDLRFPWVAFFALTYVKAGTELTWDYNYEVGSVPDKQIICQCGSPDCRGRLL